MSTVAVTQPGAVKITLHSANNDGDEKAEVTVAVRHPEEALAKMLRTLAERFPPESVMTIQPTGAGDVCGGTQTSSMEQDAAAGDGKYVISRTRDDSPYTRASSAAGSAARQTKESSRAPPYQRTLPFVGDSAKGVAAGTSTDSGRRRQRQQQEQRQPTNLPTQAGYSPGQGMPVFPGMHYPPYGYYPAGPGAEGYSSPAGMQPWPMMIPYGYPPMHPGAYGQAYPQMMDPNGPGAGSMAYQTASYAPEAAKADSQGGSNRQASARQQAYDAAVRQANQQRGFDPTQRGYDPAQDAALGVLPRDGGSALVVGSRPSECGSQRGSDPRRAETASRVAPAADRRLASASSPSAAMPAWALNSGSDLPGGLQPGMSEIVGQLEPGFGEYVHMGPDGMRTRYVEVEVHEEREVRVPKVEVVERVREVPEPHVVERVIEVDDLQVHEQVVYKDVVTEEERVIEKRVKEVREVPVERVVEKKVDVYQTREQVIEVPEYVEVDKPYDVEQRVDVPVYRQHEEPCVVAQKLRPSVRTAGKMTVPTTTYEPVLYAVDVYVPKPVANAIKPQGKIDETHQRVTVPAAQYNSLVYRLNPTLEKQVVNEVCLKTVEGHIPILPAGEISDIVAPLPGAWSGDSLGVRQRGLTTPPHEKKHKRSHSHRRRHHHHHSRPSDR